MLNEFIVRGVKAAKGIEIVLVVLRVSLQCRFNIRRQPQPEFHSLSGCEVKGFLIKGSCGSRAARTKCSSVAESGTTSLFSRNCSGRSSRITALRGSLPWRQRRHPAPRITLSRDYSRQPDQARTSASPSMHPISRSRYALEVSLVATATRFSTPMGGADVLSLRRLPRALSGYFGPASSLTRHLRLFLVRMPVCALYHSEEPASGVVFTSRPTPYN